MNTIIHQHRAALVAVKGNFLIHIPSGMTVTVVTSGPRIGIHEGGTQDEIHFAMCCSEELLGELLAERDVDIEALLESGDLMVEGDFGVYDRFMSLGKPKNALTLRMAG
jgi:hypothetical protein